MAGITLRTTRQVVPLSLIHISLPQQIAAAAAGAGLAPEDYTIRVTCLLYTSFTGGTERPSELLRCRSCGNTGRQSRLRQRPVRPARPAAPVSYTHLDVYKRQV